MFLSIRSTGCYELAAESALTLMIEPPTQGEAHLVRAEQLRTRPAAPGELRRDLYGNRQRHLRAGPGRFTYAFSGTVQVEPNQAVPEEAREHAPQEFPPEVWVFTLPSRYCQSDLLARMARSEFGRLEPGGGRVRAIASWVNEHVEYRYGTTDAQTSAYDTATERIGVCRDFAHLVIAFCRALGIPARYASGYALGLDPPDFHGYAQVYLSGAWHNVDATQAAPRPALVPIAVGRDSADVALLTSWTACRVLSQEVQVQPIREDELRQPLDGS